MKRCTAFFSMTLSFGRYLCEVLELLDDLLGGGVALIPPVDHPTLHGLAIEASDDHGAVAARRRVEADAEIEPGHAVWPVACALDYHRPRESLAVNTGVDSLGLEGHIVVYVELLEVEVPAGVQSSASQ